MISIEKVLRQEHKFLLYEQEAASLYRRLACVLAQDKHQKTGGYRVRSLYFDTPDNRDFHQKMDGVDPRRKFRLRLYDPAADWASLELKQKQGANQLKRSLRLTKEDVRELIQGRYTPLLGYNNPFAAECFVLLNEGCYRPKAIVEYRRAAFVARENNTRITFDRRIEATESCFDFFSQKLNLCPVFDTGHVILEVKYNGFLLNYIQQLLESVNRSPLAASKYCMGRSAGLSYLF